MADSVPTTGVEEIDRLIGGVVAGDNLAWEVDSGAPVDKFVSSFLSACENEGSPVIYVSFNRSPQTVTESYRGLMSPGRFTLVDCFSSGKGDGDEMFVKFFKESLSAGGGETPYRAVQIEDPADPVKLQEAIFAYRSEEGAKARYVFDSLTGMLDLWGDEDVVLRFFGHLCPRIYDLGTIAYWLLETEAHSEKFLAKLRHITQVVVEVAVSRGVHTITIRKAANRQSVDFGMPQRFEVEDGRIVIAAESREDRELGLLTRMGEALGSALDPNSFFEQTMEVLADELGMVRGTLVLLDRITNTLQIAAAHGLSTSERQRGRYAVGEGITGRVVETGLHEVVPDIGKDPRFLDRTTARRKEATGKVAFICVPLIVDEEVVGALSVDRPFAISATLEKDLRLLTIVASTVSQVLKINRLIRVEKEEILARDEKLLEELRGRYRLEKVAGQSEAIRKVLATAATAAKSQATILITGETGTGKELVANVVHYNSNRAGGPLVKVSCGALPETLLESELFGHVRGAFTGAIRDRKGRFELADGGTLFLDEVGEMSPRLQVKLLRVLTHERDQMEFEPVGSMRTVRVDVRVVAATNKDLKEGMREGWFREDLYYRLNVIPIHLPPLRDRRKDIPLLADHFLEIYNRRNEKSVTKLSREVLDLLLAYSWPGNVRELENCIERAVVMSPGEMLSLDLLPQEVVSSRGSVGGGRARSRTDQAELARLAERVCENCANLSDARETLIRTVEEALVRKALSSGISRRELADKLGMSRTTLRKKMKEYRIE